MERLAASGTVTGTVRTSDVEETRAVGRRLGEIATAGTVLALRGELGAGKTQLAKGIATGLGVTNVVNSPTFVLMNEHVGRLRLYHIDAYRLTDPEEAAAAGLLDERAVDGVTVIEWADRLEGWLPAERLDVELTQSDGATDRVLRWNARGDAHERLAAGALSTT